MQIVKTTKWDASLLFYCAVIGSSIFINTVMLYQANAYYFSILKFICVLFLLLTNRYKISLILFLIFYFTSINIYVDTISSINSFAKLKLVGPISLSQIFLLVFVILQFFGKNKIKISKFNSEILLYLSLFLIFGTLSGLVEVLNAKNFSWNSFQYYTVYFSMGLIFLLLSPLISKIDDLQIIIRSFAITSCIIPSITFLLGFEDLYSTTPVPILLAFTYVAPFIFLEKAQTKLDFILINIALLCLFYNLAQGGMGGKGILFILCFIILKIYLMNNKIKYILLIILLLISAILAPLVELLYKYENLKLFVYKLENVILLGKFALQPSNWHLIPNSPLIRLYELSIAVNYMLSDSKYLLFGMGFGGMFEDTKGFFVGLNLTSAYPDQELARGVYSRAHDTFSSLPMVFGLSGIIIWSLMIIRCIRLSITRRSLYIFVPIILFTFMFNHDYLTIFALIIASYDYRRNYALLNN